jgi:hypothetical protein
MEGDLNSLLSQKESIIILVKAAPNWSTKYKTFEICTAGINEEGEWRRLYPFPEKTMIRKEVKLWDVIEVETAKPTDDPRRESRKIKNSSIKTIDRIVNREKRKEIIKNLTESSLENALNEKRSLVLIKPIIEGFKIRKGIREPLQFTLDGQRFRKHPYGDISLIYRWSCSKSCRYCNNKSHNSRCFDWGSNYLYRKYKNEKEAQIKVRNKLLFEMKYYNDTWFALGTTRQRPWKRWMIVGLLFMKKEPRSDSQKLNNFLNKNKHAL